MLYFVTRTVDWLEKTVFKGASLPSWLTSAMPKRLAAILLVLCGLGFGAVVGLVSMVVMGAWIYWPFGLMYAISSGTIGWWAIVSLAGDVRKGWQNRRKYTFFYCPSDYSLKDCVVKREIGESFSLGNGMLLFAWPESRLFGKVRWGIDARPEGISVRFKEDKIRVGLKGTLLATGDEWLAMIFEAMQSGIQGGWTYITPYRLFLRYQSRAREQRDALRTEISGWEAILSVSKRTSGSQELGRLRERMEHVLIQLRRGEFVDFRLGAPELIRPPRVVGGRQKRVAAGGGATVSG